MDDMQKDQILANVDRAAMARPGEAADQHTQLQAHRNSRSPLPRQLLPGKGYEVELQEVEPGRLQAIATLKGSGGGKSLMLNGTRTSTPCAEVRSGTRQSPSSKVTGYTGKVSRT